MKTTIVLDLTPFAGAPDLAEIDAVARELGRTTADFVGFSAMDLARRVSVDGEPGLLEKLDAFAADCGASGVARRVKVDLFFDADPPRLEDVRALAARAGSGDRDRGLCVLTAFCAREQREILESPENKAYWDEIERRAADLPDGWGESL